MINQQLLNPKSIVVIGGRNKVVSRVTFTSSTPRRMSCKASRPITT